MTAAAKGTHAVGNTANKFRTHGLRTGAVALLACLPLAAACSTGFGAPTRQDVANLQATMADVGNTLQVRDLFVALPNGSSAAKGGTAYVELVALNLADQDDKLVQVTANTQGTSSSGPVAQSVAAVGDETIPAKTSKAPGQARLYFALQNLTTALKQGDSVSVTLQFQNAGSAQNLIAPVRGTDVVSSSFLPSAAASLPASGSPAASAPASGSAPASPPASSSLPASANASPTSSP